MSSTEARPAEASAQRHTARNTHIGVWAWALLVAAVVASAVGVVYAKHLERAAFVDLQQLLAERDVLLENWGRLLLEQSTWATHGRIETLARKRLGMLVPETNAIVVMRP
jgi:cell division protein FtsL